ncbi:MAG: hypothetical protein RIR52_2453 [Acidobacteriota bacterium]
MLALIVESSTLHLNISAQAENKIIIQLQTVTKICLRHRTEPRCAEDINPNRKYQNLKVLQKETRCNH